MQVQITSRINPGGEPYSFQRRFRSGFERNEKDNERSRQKFITIQSIESMGAYPPQGTGIGAGQVKKIVEETTETLAEQIKKLREQLEKRERKDDEFKRKLEASISQLRETDNEIADRFDKLLQGWNYL